MGNSHSQSLSRFTPSLLHNNSNNSNQREGRGRKSAVSKFASPENRVLPVVSNIPQRLRSTDNGNILQSGGTISGRKNNVLSLSNSEPEFVQLLQKKCHALQSSSQNVSFQTLYGHRKSHSDPDIVRMMMYENENETDDEDNDNDGRCETEGSSNQRSIIAVSPSKAKIKSRKKKKAPEPPQPNTLPRTLSRTPVNYKKENQRIGNHGPSYESNDAPRRPLPPIPSEEMPPPPPPPPPDYNRGGDERANSKTFSKNYEKNRRMVDKWKFSKQNQEVHVEKMHRQRSKSLDRTEEQRLRENESCKRHETFERNNSLRNTLSKEESFAYPADDKTNATANSALKDAIADAAKRRAERIERSREHRNPSFKSSMKHTAEVAYSREHEHKDSYLNGNPVQYSNKNPYLFKHTEATKPVVPKHRFENRPDGGDIENSTSHNFTRKVPIHKKVSETRKDYRGDCLKRNDERVHKNILREHHDFMSSDSKQNKWDSIIPQPIPRYFPEGAISSSSTSEEEMEIDLQLRPTLPRRPVELPRFSPTDVWKSINLDFFKSHQQRYDVSSDEGEDVLEEKIRRINRPVAPRRLIHDRSGDSGISPDAGSPMLMNENFDVPVLNNTPMCNTPDAALLPEETNAAWVPQQDLDESECGSDDSPIDNQNKQSKTNIQAKFAMPNLMFPSRSLPRTDQRNGIEDSTVLEKERTRSRGRRKKSCKNSEGQHFNSLRNLKKALGLRTKPPVDENRGLDPNWSLSRSLPNFINNLNGDNEIKNEAATPEAYILDNIRRCNSESRAIPHENDGNKITAAHSSQNINAEWRKSFPGQSSEGHVIYLPEYSSSAIPNQQINANEDIHVNTDSELVLKKPNGRKKFTYQSTVRQEEKKKLEEKLAREVAARERKRQEEIEWMNKVEDEFRKQRDKEKVNIRHQLRILNLQEKSDINDPHRKEITKNDMEEFIENEPKLYHTPPSEEKLHHPAKNGQDFTDASYNWNQPTGMKKWLRRQNRDYQYFSPTRPEPEGGRSSSDDCKQMDGRKITVPERSQSRSFSKQINGRPKCNHLNEASYGCNNSVDKLNELPRNGSQNKSPSLEDRCSTLASSEETKKAELSKTARDQMRPKSQTPVENGQTGSYPSVPPESNDCHYVSESVEEYELHTRLCRTNSGRTFESHTYYALERRKEDSEYDVLRKPICNGDSKPNFFSTLNFEKELKENVRKKTREFEKRTRKYQSCDYDSDDSGSDGREVRHQRHVVRNQKKKQSSDGREPSFSRNHPHRNGARIKSQMNGHAVNGKPVIYAKSPSSRVMLPQQ